MGFSCRLHDPYVSFLVNGLILFKFISENNILGREDEGGGVKIVGLGLSLFSLSLQVLFMLFQISNKHILAAELVEISKTGYPLVGEQPLLIQLINVLFLAPTDIPVIAFSPLISFLLKSIINAVGAICFELYLSAA